MTAIVAVESGGDPLAIGDNTTRVSYYPHSLRAAENLAVHLIRAGHSVDLGLAQINDANLTRVALSVGAAFGPCANLRAAETILQEAYFCATEAFGSGQTALRAAIGMYNAGRLDAGRSYVRRVLLAAGLDAEECCTFSLHHVSGNDRFGAPRSRRDPGVTQERRRAQTISRPTPFIAPIVLLGNLRFSTARP